MAWLIEGCLEWQSIGLKPPAAVVEATKEYIETEDIFGRWIEECFDRAKGWISSADVFAEWQQWANDNNEAVGTQTALSKTMGERGFVSKLNPQRTARGFDGLKLKETAPAQPITLTMHCHHETSTGVLLSISQDAEPVWMPKAPIQMTYNQDGTFEVTIPGWLAKKHGLKAIDPVPF